MLASYSYLVFEHCNELSVFNIAYITTVTKPFITLSRMLAPYQRMFMIRLIDRVRMLCSAWVDKLMAWHKHACPFAGGHACNWACNHACSYIPKSYKHVYYYLSYICITHSDIDLPYSSKFPWLDIFMIFVNYTNSCIDTLYSYSYLGILAFSPPVSPAWTGQ